ncbi:hypothetical protein M8C21_000342, partial [Ambrosia artemisiifolia]
RETEREATEHCHRSSLSHRTSQELHLFFIFTRHHHTRTTSDIEAATFFGATFTFSLLHINYLMQRKWPKFISEGLKCSP